MTTDSTNNNDPKLPGYDRYIRSVNANLLYWQQQLEGATDAELLQLRGKFALVCRAISQAEVKVETRKKAGELALLAFNFVERSGQWSEWCHILEQVITSSRQKMKIKLLIQQGQFYLLDQEIEKAIESQQKILDTYPHVAETTRAKAHVNLSCCYLTQGKFVVAETHLDKVVASPTIFQNDIRWDATTKNCLGRLYYEGKSDFLKARIFFEESGDKYLRFDDTINYARVLHNLGDMFVAWGRHEEALSHLYKARNIHIEVSAKLDVILVEMSIGIALFNLGMCSEAKKTLLSIDSQFLETYGFTLTHARVLNNLGHLFIETGEYKKARGYLEDCLPIWEELNKIDEYANSLGAIGRSHYLDGDLLLANTLLSRAIQFLSDAQPTNNTKEWLKEYKEIQSKC